ncbi:hypothetical protein F3Y22_tig00111947pilonHSYRG00185 [Hibiscus syriacus]|uniref:RNase H type-1 domain-containing protein n=1 Tax=Hibiscus syriacus TaxID=106335 RepID=A0A6A2XX89_HIBSY|nr:hypothetical protein F3Y22_tig00111947pilonHSYRG00185 [Hibiscus syriacus]
MAEAFAILQGLQFARDLGFPRIILESDSKKIVQKLSESTINLSDISPFLRDVKVTAGALVSCSFVFISRNDNRAAHAMALEGSWLVFDQFWAEDVPEEAVKAADDEYRFIDPP